MDFMLRIAGLAAFLCSAAAWPQAGSHAGAHAPAAMAKPPAAESKPTAPGARKDTPAAYRSAFEGYRAYNADEPARDWRAANEEVRAAGGHLGLLKGTEGEPAHAHGAKAKEAGRK